MTANVIPVGCKDKWVVTSSYEEDCAHEYSIACGDTDM